MRLEAGNCKLGLEAGILGIELGFAYQTKDICLDLRSKYVIGLIVTTAQKLANCRIVLNTNE